MYSFPNLAVSDPVKIAGVILESGTFGVKPAGETSKRDIELVSAHIIWAAYCAGLAADCGIYVKHCGRLVSAKTPASIESLLPYMPTKPDIAVYWFAKYIQANTESRRVIYLYNALGSLPGGFEGIAGLFQVAGCEELGRKFLREVAALRAEDDDTGPAIYHPSLSEYDFKQSESIVVN
jgi:hypothetical protein